MSPNSLITSSDYNQSGNDRYDDDDDDDNDDDDDDDDKDDDCVVFNNDDSFNIGSDVVTIDNVDDNDDDDDNHHNSGMKGVNPIVTTTTPATISGFSMKIEKIYQRDHDDENSFYYEKSPSMNVITNGGRYVKYIKAESGVLRLGSTCITV